MRVSAVVGLPAAEVAGLHGSRLALHGSATTADMAGARYERCRTGAPANTRDQVEAVFLR